MSPGDSTVLFRALSREDRLSPTERRAVRAFASQLMAELGNSSSFTCLLTSDQELQDLNRRFLQHDYPTDVLSFPAVEPWAELGEVAISVHRAAEQAKEHGHNRLDEIKILMLHGMLHLIGLDHEHDGGEMAELEERWRETFGLPTALISRSRKELTR